MPERETSVHDQQGRMTAPSGSAEATRFPLRVFGSGVEPDPRFTLANERTFLAWIRTALALIAGGVALTAVSLDLEQHFRLAASLVLTAGGLSLSIGAWHTWMRHERALRSARPLSPPTLALPLAATVALTAPLLFAGTVTR